MHDFQESIGEFCPNPHDLTLHKQIKDISDMLRPELLRLYNTPNEASGNISLYVAFIEAMRSIKQDVTNCDALFTFHNILSHMMKVIELSEAHVNNQEVLWHLQEVMALLFKVQNLPS